MAGVLQLLGGTAKGMATLTMDQEYINRFRVRPSSYRQRMLQGVQIAGVGIYEGIIGGLPAAPTLAPLCPAIAHQ